MFHICRTGYFILISCFRPQTKLKTDRAGAGPTLPPPTEAARYLRPTRQNSCVCFVQTLGDTATMACFAAIGTMVFSL